MSLCRTLAIAASLMMGAQGCEPSADDAGPTAVSRVEIMNLAVAQQVGAPALAAVFPSTRTRDRQIQDEPHLFTTSTFDADGRLIRIEMTNLLIMEQPYRVITVDWVEDVVAGVNVLDRQIGDEPHAETITDGI